MPVDVEGVSYHIPVLVKEVVSLLIWKKQGIYVDCTVGTGGHAEAILKSISPDGRLIGVDRDGQAITIARRRLECWGRRALLFHDNFRNIVGVTGREGISEVSGFIFDLGCSSLQLDTPERGFSFRYDAPLDMRMDARVSTTAFDLVNTLSQKELTRIIKQYGEEKLAGKISSRIITERKKSPVKTTLQLSKIVTDVYQVGFPYLKPRIHPATKTFQALRIAVNKELDFFEEVIKRVCFILEKRGRIAIISYHSLEDRIVKRTFQQLARNCHCPPELPECRCDRQPVLKIITKHPFRSSRCEVESNPRSRSAKLRVGERV